MLIRVDEFRGLVEVRLGEEKEYPKGGSSMLLTKKDGIEVWTGNLETKVVLTGLCLCIIMPPEKGNWHRWKNPDWARNEAINRLNSEVTGLDLFIVFQGARKIGRKEGEAKAKSDIRKALGVGGEEYGYDDEAEGEEESDDDDDDY